MVFAACTFHTAGQRDRIAHVSRFNRFSTCPSHKGKKVFSGTSLPRKRSSLWGQERASERKDGAGINLLPDITMVMLGWNKCPYPEVNHIRLQSLLITRRIGRWN